MKRSILFFSSLFFIGAVYCQDLAEPQSQAPPYDSSFKALYKAVALHPGYRNWEGVIHDSVVKRWDKDIIIYVEACDETSRRKVIRKLKNTIALLAPALNNKINISFTTDKASANYLVHISYLGRTGWHIKWDGRNNIYNCIMVINARSIFNREQQVGLASHYFLQSLGDFVFNRKDRPAFASDTAVSTNLSLWRQDITSTDLQILKVHYADEIRPGMARKDIDQYFEKHGN
jgi:hypothetical protein